MKNKVDRYDIVEEYIELNFNKQKTKYQYRNALNKYFRFLRSKGRISLPDNYFDGNRDINEYGDDVKLYWNLMQETLSPKSIAPQLSTIRNFLEENGKEFGGRFWKKLSKRGKGNGTVIIDRIPTIEELQKILSYGSERHRAYFLVMLSSGMREIELSKLKISNIDFNSKPTKIYLPATITKNKKERITFITEEATKALKIWLSIRDEYIEVNQRRSISLKKYLESKGTKVKYRAGERVFPWDNNTTRLMWNSLLRKAGLDNKDNGTGKVRELHVYVLRKFFETRLSSVISEKFVKFMEGHSGYMSDPYFRPVSNPEQLDELKEMYKKGSSRLLVFEVPENQEAVDNIEKQMEQLQQQIRELKEFKERVGPKLTVIDPETGMEKIDDYGNPIEVVDPSFPDEIYEIALKKEKEMKQNKWLKENIKSEQDKIDYEKLVQSFGEKTAKAVWKVRCQEDE